jgi:hypothetical protein
MSTTPTLHKFSPDENSLVPAQCRLEARRSAHALLRRQGVSVSTRHVHAIDIAAEAAAAEGYECGELEGYTSGWRFGLVCGITLGALVSAVCVFLGAQAGMLP